jgi:hypothetical protein
MKNFKRKSPKPTRRKRSNIIPMHDPGLIGFVMTLDDGKDGGQVVELRRHNKHSEN